MLAAASIPAMRPRVLGHASPSLTLGLYGHATEERQRKQRQGSLPAVATLRVLAPAVRGPEPLTQALQTLRTDRIFSCHVRVACSGKWRDPPVTEKIMNLDAERGHYLC